eukprot:9478498-Pyramimonas_sp.AAC.1
MLRSELAAERGGRDGLARRVERRHPYQGPEVQTMRTHVAVGPHAEEQLLLPRAQQGSNKGPTRVQQGYNKGPTR